MLHFIIILKTLAFKFLLQKDYQIIIILLSLEIPILISSSCVALKSYIIFALWFTHLIKQTKPISENMKENMNLNSRRIKS